MLEANSSTDSSFSYQFGGSLDSESPSYVTRQADQIFDQALRAGQFCYVLNSRQMGKSSLRVRVMNQLQKDGFICLFVDLTGMGKQDVTPEKWYAGIVQALVSSCPVPMQVSWRTWWRECQDFFGPAQRLRLFIEEVLLVEIPQNIIIFIDEIDRVLSQNFSLDDFFDTIRFCLEQRPVNPQYRRLTFALLGVASPTDLIRDKSQTLFNVGTVIDLKGFELHEVQVLIQGLSLTVPNPESVMADILRWTGGQPFLTQKLCQLVAGNSKSMGGIEQAVSIEKIVRSHILENWEFQDEPEHLRTIRDRLLRNPSKTGRLLGLYQQILLQNGIPTDGSPDQMELRLTGLVVDQQGKLQVHNQICRQVFDRGWVEQQLAQMRPYAGAITQWIASGHQDASALLQGQILQDALAWALGKNLSDQDFQFLVASQNLAKQQTQQALEATAQASQLLAAAQQRAKRELAHHRLKWHWIPKITLAVTLPFLALRAFGLLQGLEWNLWDQFVRLRPLEPPDNRIALVTIDETDMTKVGTWPIPDRVLAQVLRQVSAQKPQVIGLDLYRNLPVEPGHQELSQLFQTLPNLYGIEKIVNPKVPPPHTLNPQQIGFADQVVDTDNKIRRALISVGESDHEVSYSLATQLALHYLTEAGVDLSATDKGQVHLGKAIVNRFEGNDGGYVRAQSGGYQILLNYHGTQRSFATYTLRQIMDGKLPDNVLRDRVVLIGTTADSLNDMFYTPYSGKLFQSPEPMAGVVLHANITSQLLSAALDGRPLLNTWPDALEWLWIGAWATLGGWISWRSRSLGAIAIGLVLASGALVGTCFGLFILGWWVPFVPTAFGLLGTATLIPIIANRQRDQVLFDKTLTSLLAVYPSHPIATQIALEYLKQSETKEHQVLIEQQIRNQGEANQEERTHSVGIGSSWTDLRKSDQIPLKS